MAMLHGEDSQLGFSLFHHDVIPPGTSIGEHLHTNTEEIYFLLSGDCVLLYDGTRTDMQAGDFSIVNCGHSHGIINVGDTPAELIVVEIK